MDFIKLNISNKSSWPLPIIDNMLAALGKTKCFTTLDLKNSYWQIPLNKGDKEEIAFTCKRGFYKYNVMPFAVANTTGIFQEIINSFAMAYLDNIIIFSTSEEHEQHIQKLVDSPRQHNLILKLPKCEFM